jgi:uncharacterized protein YbjT (DUF2867 family)
LLAAGHEVRVLVRDEAKARRHPWADQVELVVGDASDTDDVRTAMHDVDVLYYLLHSIGTGGDFGSTEKDMAQRFAAEAQRAGVRRIVYLGGMIPDDEELSEHLSSRGEVGDVLLASGVPTTVLQAGVIIGSGSASFEMLRYLTERLPVMITPKWVGTRIQPIAISDVLRYLVGSAQMPADVSRRFDIGGPEVLTYLDLMQRFAAISQLPRPRVLKVPVLSPGLSSHWVGLITPVPARLARPLVESLRNTVVASDTDIAAYVPDPPDGLLTFDRSVERALTRIQELDVPTPWPVDPMGDTSGEGLPTDPGWAGGSLYAVERRQEVAATPDALRAAIQRADRWHTEIFRWRAENVDDGKAVRLRVVRPLPGLAWLELRITSTPEGSTELVGRTLFHPQGLLGHAAWWIGYPLHRVAAAALQRDIAKKAAGLAG